MEEEHETTTDDSKPGLTDVLFDQLGLGPMVISQMMNGFIRDEVLRSLIRAGILTTDQLEATVKEAHDHATEFCDGIESKNGSKHSREVVQKMRDAANQIAQNTRERVIQEPSIDSQSEQSAEGQTDSL